MKIWQRLCVISVLLPLLMHTDPTHGADSTFTCTLDDGSKVDIVEDNTIDNIAISRVDSDGTHKIVVNMMVMKSNFSLPTRLFWMAHECAHHQLGHVYATSNIKRAEYEREADCYGVVELVKDGRLDNDDLSTIIDEVSGIQKGQTQYYLSGPQRASDIKTCAIDQAKQQAQ